MTQDNPQTMPETPQLSTPPQIESSQNEWRNIDNISYYAICLADNKERAKSVKQITKMIPETKIVKAINAYKFTKKDILALQKSGKLPENERLVDNYVMALARGRKLKIGELGCFLSHLKVIKLIANGTAPGGVVFEDDIIPIDDFKEKLGTVLKYLPENIDHLAMYTHNEQMYIYNDKRKDENLFSIYPIPPGLSGTQCYFMTKKGAQFALKQLKTMYGAIDEMMTRIGMFSYLVDMNFVYENTNVTEQTIQHDQRYVSDLLI